MIILKFGELRVEPSLPNINNMMMDGGSIRFENNARKCLRNSPYTNAPQEDSGLENFA